MTAKEAIYELKRKKPARVFGTELYCKAYDMAIEALEKQIPYKGEDIVTSDNEWVGTICKCGIGIYGIPDLMGVCPKCLQVIDWSEVE